MSAQTAQSKIKHLDFLFNADRGLINRWNSTCVLFYFLLPFRPFRFLFVLNIFETLLSLPVAAATIFCLFLGSCLHFDCAYIFLSDPVLPVELLIVLVFTHFLVR